MRGKMIVGMVAAILVWMSSTTLATEYYVSPSGNDSDAGTTPGQAWKTIGKVNSQDFGPSDSIFFEGSQTFSGSLYFDVDDSGTPTNPVTVGSYGSGRATINSGSDNGLYAHNCAGFKVTDLIFVGSGRTDINGGGGIYFHMNLSGNVKLEYVHINNVDVSGYRNTGICVQGGNELSGYKDVRITNAISHDNGDKGIYVSGALSSGWGNQDVYIGDSTAYDNAGISGLGGHSGNGIMVAQTDGAVFEYCEAYNNGWLCDSGGGGPVGIWAWDAKNVVIQLCESHDNRTGPGSVDGGGFDLDGASVNCIMQYNYSHDNDGAGYLICQFNGAREYRNNAVRYNISENDGLKKGYGPILLYSSGSSGGIQDTQIYNNTLYVGSNTTGAGIIVWTGDIYNTYIYNNIIVTAPDKQVVSMTNTSGGYSFKGNCYWTYGDNIEIDWGGTLYTSLAAWRSATGQERHGGVDVGLEVDPQLVNPGAGGTIGNPHLLWTLNDYRLKSSSQLINAGLDIQTEFGINPGARDYYGTNIPAGNEFDIGAHEYNPTALPVARDDKYSVFQNAVLNISSTTGILANDYTPNGTLTAISVSQPANGSLSLNPDGSFGYDPDDTFAGMDTFTYKADDGQDKSNTATVYIKVLDPHPVANNDNYNAVEDITLNVDADSGVLDNDYSPGGSLSATIVSQASNGSVTLNPDGSFTYSSGFVGADTFTYKAARNGYESNVATVTINVTSNNPVAQDDSYGTAANTELSVTGAAGVLANDLAYKGSLTAILVSPPSHGSLTLHPDGSFKYNPDGTFTGMDSFSYRANDGQDNSNVATVYISVGTPIGWWKFDDGSGTIAENSGTLGSSHNGTLTYMDNSDWVEGHIGSGALEFDGVDDYVSIPALNLNSNTVTITCWMKRNGTQAGTYTGIVFSRAVSTVAGVSFGKGAGGFSDINHELAYNWNNDQAAWDWHSGLIIPDNEWVFIALVVEPTKVTQYLIKLDGTISSATKSMDHAIEQFDGITRIGTDSLSPARFFKGWIDDVRIYNRALPQGEIKQAAGKVDVMLVLDRSGSMGEPASQDFADSKINVLKDAADQFIHIMEPDIANRLGLVQFNQDVVPFDPAHDAALSELTTARAALLRNSAIVSISSGGRTSIGDGLQEALNQLVAAAAGSDSKQVMLLVTDGKENEPLWIDDVRDGIINAKVAVYPLGLGYGTGINQGKLTNLAEKTDGKYNITSNPLTFKKFFIQILAWAVDWSVVTDPITSIAPGQSVMIPVEISSDESGATFTAYWEEIDRAIGFALVSPSGIEINPKMRRLYNSIRYGDHRRYAFYQLEFPLDGNLASQWAGTWQMKLTGRDQKVRCSASAFAEGGARLLVDLDRFLYLTGEPVRIKARLLKNGKPLRRVKIKVFCDAPVTGIGNILRKHRVSIDKLKKLQKAQKDTQNLAELKLQLLAERLGEKMFRRTREEFMLYDDGKHNDGQPDDGLYANIFDKTKIPGAYTLRVVASDIPTSSRNTVMREWTQSFYTEVNIDSKYSYFKVSEVDRTRRGRKINVKFVPKDRFDNNLGPGHKITAVISHTGGKRQLQLTDNLDGTYTKDVLLTTKELRGQAKLQIVVDDDKFRLLKKQSGEIDWTYTATESLKQKR